MAWLPDWLELLGRWLHLITGIAWIGSSLYFIWLDNSLTPAKRDADTERGVSGELWAVHGGGFYHAQKYAGAPPEMPEHLHWFKWEAYSTWLSGMFLLILIYWVGAEVYLIDPSVMALSPGQAVGIAIGYLAGGWIIYDQLCKSPLGKNDRALSVVLFAVLVLIAWSLCQVFGGRGAFIHYGALIGTIMVANVAHIIIPGQRRMVAALTAGEPINPADGARGKQRSVHNTFLTLPVLFVMISNHYAATYSSRWNWLILIGITVAGALIRVYFVSRHKGNASPLPAIGGVLALAVTAFLTYGMKPTAGPTETQGAIDTEAVTAIVMARCTPCHASAPSWPGFTSAPAGLVLENADEVLRNAEAIHEQTVTLRAMPIGNLTEITDAERADIAAWYQSL